MQKRTEIFKLEQESSQLGITKHLLRVQSELSKKVGKALQGTVVGRSWTTLSGKVHMHLILHWDDCLGRRLSRVTFSRALFSVIL